jgi:hypothetical protein
MNRAEMSGFIEVKFKEVVKANNEELQGSIRRSDKPSSAISILTGQNLNVKVTKNNLNLM